VTGRIQCRFLKWEHGPKGGVYNSGNCDRLRQSVAAAHVSRCRRPRNGNGWRGCRLDCGLTRCGRGGLWRRARARNQRQAHDRYNTAQ